MNISFIEQILQEFANYFLEVGGIVLVSPEGQLITPSIGIEENTSLLMAGTLLQVSNRIAQECAWQKTEQISLQAKEGYLTLLPCTEEAFILIKTNGIPNGNLKREMQQVAKKLEAQLNSIPSPSYPDTSSALTQTTEEIYHVTYTEFDLNSDPDFIRHCEQELAEYIGPIAPIICQRLLKQNSERSTTEFVELLAKKIPNSEQALEFRQRLFSWLSNSNLQPTYSQS